MVTGKNKKNKNNRKKIIQINKRKKNNKKK